MLSLLLPLFFSNKHENEVKIFNIISFEFAFFSSGGHCVFPIDPHSYSQSEIRWGQKEGFSLPVVPTWQQ